MTEDWQRPDAFRESEARIAEAIATGDSLQLRSSDERCSYSWALARLGEWDRAEEAARAIRDDEDERGQALAILAQRLAAAGFAERAEFVALSITNDVTYFGAVHEKMIAIIECARAYCRSGLPQQVA